jgi:hypothetical protein
MGGELAVMDNAISWRLQVVLKRVQLVIILKTVCVSKMYLPISMVAQKASHSLMDNVRKQAQFFIVALAVGPKMVISVSER